MQIGFEWQQHGIGVHGGQIAVIKLQFAFIGNDVHCRTTVYSTDVQRAEWHIKRGILLVLGLQLLAQALQKHNDAGGVIYRVHALWCQRRVGGMAMHFAGKHIDAFVCHHHLHAGGFSHNALLGRQTILLQLLQHHGRTQTTNFLIIAERQVYRLAQFGLQSLRHHVQTSRNKAFHVTRAATIQFAIADVGLKRVAGPLLSVYRHHIGVA